MPDQAKTGKGKKISTPMIIGGIIALGLGIWWYTKHQASSAASSAPGAPGDGMTSGVPGDSGLGDNGQDLDEILRDLNGHPPRHVRERNKRKPPPWKFRPPVRKKRPPVRQWKGQPA